MQDQGQRERGERAQPGADQVGGGALPAGLQLGRLDRRQPALRLLTGIHARHHIAVHHREQVPGAQSDRLVAVTLEEIDSDRPARNHGVPEEAVDLLGTLLGGPRARRADLEQRAPVKHHRRFVDRRRRRSLQCGYRCAGRADQRAERQHASGVASWVDHASSMPLAKRRFQSQGARCEITSGSR